MDSLRAQQEMYSDPNWLRDVMEHEKEMMSKYHDSERRRLCYRVTTWHGEGRSVFYVIDTHDEEQPSVVASCDNLEVAEQIKTLLSLKEKR